MQAGNSLFRDLVSNSISLYVKADSKATRGLIISDIVQKVQSQSPSGTGFLKMNQDNGRWIFIGINKAKDKVGHALRKAVMSEQKGAAPGTDDGDEGKDWGGYKLAGRKAKAPLVTSIPASNKNKRKAPELVSILKRGRHATATYQPTAIATESKAAAAPPPEDVSILFGSHSVLTPTNLSATPTAGDDGVSPVARDMFDDTSVSLTPLRRRPRRAMPSRTSLFSSHLEDSPPYLSPSGEPSSSSPTTDRHYRSDPLQHGETSRREAPGYPHPPWAPINESVLPYYPQEGYVPPVLPSNLSSHPAVPPPHPFSGAATSSISGGAPPIMLQPSPPLYFYPPGYYYFPGNPYIPPPPGMVLAAPHPPATYSFPAAGGVYYHPPGPIQLPVAPEPPSSSGSQSEQGSSEKSEEGSE
jgi:hypothetical protein